MSKNIVILFDGTLNSNANGKTNTNIWWLNKSISPSNQIKIYKSGVGEGVGGFLRIMYSIFGKGVFNAARSAWLDISVNYQDGDKIFIFGFSRGAYAARHLAGMLVRYGVKGYQGKIEASFRKYLVECGQPLQSVQAKVQLLGLFDCVPGNHLYLMLKRSSHLNHNILEEGILHFRHGVSNLERRYSFRPLLFKTGKQESFKQIWFPGYHSDVGGYKDNSVGLSSFSLWWMLREAYGLGLEINNIDCEHHHFGNALGVVQLVNPNDIPTNSDYLSTKLGLTWERLKREKDIQIDTVLNFQNLVSCPRCGKPMFSYYMIDYFKQNSIRNTE